MRACKTMVLLYKSRTQIRTRYRNKKLYHQWITNAKSSRSLSDYTSDHIWHSLLRQDRYCQPERCGSQLYPGYDCSPKPPISCSLQHPLNPTSHSTTAVHKPTSKRAPNNSENQHCHFTEPIPALVPSPFFRDVASRETKLITNSLGCFVWFFLSSFWTQDAT